jgi:WD40 repeat protein
MVPNERVGSSHRIEVSATLNYNSSKIDLFIGYSLIISVLGFLTFTMCRDRTVKVWDLSSCSSGVCPGESDELMTSNDPPPVGGASSAIGTGATQKAAYVLHTPAAVGRVAWRPSSPNDSMVQRRQLQLATSSPDRGEVSVWAVNMPNIPVCVLKGHSSEACTGIFWLDTPVSEPEKAPPIGPEKSKTSFMQRKETAPPVKKGEPTWLGVHQHILSSGKDGRLMVQDLRNGTFPRQHIARSVAVISSMGHVAYQRGEVSRVSNGQTFLRNAWLS